jgi:hypothetical protein
MNRTSDYEQSYLGTAIVFMDVPSYDSLLQGVAFLRAAISLTFADACEPPKILPQSLPHSISPALDRPLLLCTRRFFAIGSGNRPLGSFQFTTGRA